MKGKIENKEQVRKNTMDTANMAEMEFWFSSVIGATFFYCINFGQKPFKELNDEQFIKRNAMVGWIVQMVVIFGGLYLLFMVMS